MSNNQYFDKYMSTRKMLPLDRNTIEALDKIKEQMKLSSREKTIQFLCDIGNEAISRNKIVTEKFCPGCEGKEINQEWTICPYCSKHLKIRHRVKSDTKGATEQTTEQEEQKKPWEQFNMTEEDYNRDILGR